MAQKALSNPASIAALRPLPSRNSSFIRSKMITLASTAIPIVRMKPAMLGRVRVKLNAERTLNIM